MLKRCLFLVSCLLLGFVKLESATYLPHVLPGFEYEHQNKWEGPFFFISIADCQLGFLTNNKDWTTEISLLEQVVTHINRLKPAFVILCGDMVHQPPHGKLHDRELADYKRIVSKIDPSIPLICVCGNHDVWNIPEARSVLTYEKEFKTPHYFVFWVKGVQCLALNSSLIADPSRMPDIYQEQFTWFQKQLDVKVAGHNPPHRLVFQHHPWFLKTFKDADSRLSAGQVAIIPTIRRLPFLELMAKADVTACFSGHLHRNNYANYEGIEMITSAAVAVPSVSGLRIVKVYENRIEHAYYKIHDIPAKVSL